MKRVILPVVAVQQDLITIHLRYSENFVFKFKSNVFSHFDQNPIIQKIFILCEKIDTESKSVKKITET